MDKRLDDLMHLAKGIESNVYTSCVINICPQDADNILWAIERIKELDEHLRFEVDRNTVLMKKCNSYRKALEQIERVSKNESVEDFMAYGYVAKQALEGK